MPTQEQVQALIDQLLADGRTPDEIQAGLQAAFQWTPQQAREVILQSERNRGQTSVNIGGSVVDFGAATGQIQPLPIPETPAGTITGISPAQTPTPTPSVFGTDVFTPEVPTPAQAFSRFIATQPFAASPGIRAAAGRLRPLLETQFALQPNVGLRGRQGFDEFADFLRGGARLTGPALVSRLQQVGGALGQQLGAIDPSDLLGTALQEQFIDPSNAFSAFNLPALQSAGGAGRRLLQQGFDRFQNRFLGQNPLATGADVARLYGVGL